MAETTRFELATFGLTGRYANRYTTPPINLLTGLYHGSKSLSSPDLKKMQIKIFSINPLTFSLFLTTIELNE